MESSPEAKHRGSLSGEEFWPPAAAAAPTRYPHLEAAWRAKGRPEESREEKARGLGGAEEEGWRVTS